MDKLVKFENTSIDVQIINGIPMFELYAVGMALGQIKKNSKGTLYPAKDRIDKNVKNAEIQPCVRNAHSYITESQIYDLMLETKTDKCRAFRKWLTNEVLPELNKTGSYSTPKAKQEKQLELYNYVEKTYNGEPVMTVADVKHFTNIEEYQIRRILKAAGKEGSDYHILKGRQLVRFKIENKSTHSPSNILMVVTRTGFGVICGYSNIEAPKLFLETKTVKEYVVVIGNQQIKSSIEKIRKHMTAIDVLLDKYYRHNIELDDMNALRKTLREIGLELGAEISGLGREKFETTTKMKL